MSNILETPVSPLPVDPQAALRRTARLQQLIDNKQKQRADPTNSENPRLVARLLLQLSDAQTALTTHLADIKARGGVVQPPNPSLK